MAVLACGCIPRIDNTPIIDSRKGITVLKIAKSQADFGLTNRLKN
jgi:hypothetical protein